MDAQTLLKLNELYYRPDARYHSALEEARAAVKDRGLTIIMVDVGFFMTHAYVSALAHPQTESLAAKPGE